MFTEDFRMEYCANFIQTFILSQYASNSLRIYSIVFVYR